MYFSAHFCTIVCYSLIPQLVVWRKPQESPVSINVFVKTLYPVKQLYMEL